jgi:peroxiredoxin Q/BCP
MHRSPALAVLVATTLLGSGVARGLEVGQKAPDFALRGSDGKTYRLADFVGTRGFVLAWFPKAFTPGCTAELGSLRDGAAELARYDADVFMVSYDSPETNAAFARSQNAQQVLLSDPGGEVATAFGVAGALFAQRWTFYVDRDGVVREVDRSVDTSNAGADIARRLGELGFPKRP